jgi:hypothetical protein
MSHAAMGGVSFSNGDRPGEYAFNTFDGNFIAQMPVGENPGFNFMKIVILRHLRMYILREVYHLSSNKDLVMQLTIVLPIKATVRRSTILEVILIHLPM